MARHKVVEFNGLDQMQSVVTVYALNEQFLYRTFVERQTFSSAPKQVQARRRYVADMLETYGALGEVHHCYFEATDDWDDTDPVQRDRRGLT